MLRVQPTPDRYLFGADNCGGRADKCPNSVGNVKSGESAVISQIRRYEWFVVDVKTIEHGVRTGFVK